MPSALRKETFFEEEQRILENAPHLQREEEKRAKARAQKHERGLMILTAFGIAFVLLLGGIFIAFDSNRVYEARVGLENERADLNRVREKTAQYENEREETVSLSDLYDYAVGELGMQPAGKEDITHLGPLEKTGTQVVHDTGAAREPVKIHFHLFG